MRPEEELGRVLREKGKTLAVAESCTGGLVSDMITDVPRSSRYFLAGIVAYSNEAKVNLIGVRSSTLKSFGAVSEQTAIEMAQGVREVCGADIGAAVTGIAGPGGGTPEKPVGLVHFALDLKGSIVVDHVLFRGDRTRVKDSSAKHLLRMIVKSLK
ncbi:MAG: CinA family protein [Methanomassiliicoccales archaeon]|jgi:PncC family amidohydrolase